MKLLIFFLFILSVETFAKALDRIQHFNWDGVEVVWIEDKRLPLFEVALYFADGASSDQRGYAGATEMMFNEIEKGTNRYSQKQISDSLEYYGAGYGASVTHEYSVYNVTGLVKDAIPIMKMVCHLFSNATFPSRELKKTKVRITNGLKNLPSSHSSLADRVFRKVSLQGTPYEYPTSGEISSLKRIGRGQLSKKLQYFKKQVKKKIYLAGPKEVLVVKDILAEECGFDYKNSQFTRVGKNTIMDPTKVAGIYLLPVPKANQAQIRIGRFLSSNELENPTLLAASSHYLGGGFTSKLNRRIRVEQGLTYGIGAISGVQKRYGRSSIRSSTRNDSVVQLISSVKEVLEQTSKGTIVQEELKRSIGSLSGSYLFKFEQNSAFLSNLIYMDHVGRPFSELYEFPKIVNSFGIPDISKKTSQVFDWEKLTVLVVGNKNLAKELKKLGKVKILKMKNFL